MSISRSLPDEWIVLANSTCFGGQVAVGVLAQLVGQDQQAVERRAQLVRHVRQELGLVLGGQRELLGLFLERLARLLDFLVLALDLLVLVGEQPRLLLQLLVGLLQLLLPALQLLRERLRLLEQVLGPHVGLDRVEHDADRFGELVEERLVRRVEAARTTRARARPSPALRTRPAARGCCAAARRRGPRRSGCSRGGTLVEQDLLLLERALADQPLAELELLADARLRRSSA